MDHSGYDRNASQPQQINIVPTAVPHFLKSPLSCLSFNVEKAFQTELGCVDVGLNFSHIKFPKFMSFCEQDNHMLYKMPNETFSFSFPPSIRQNLWTSWKITVHHCRAGQASLILTDY